MAWVGCAAHHVSEASTVLQREERRGPGSWHALQLERDLAQRRASDQQGAITRSGSWLVVGSAGDARQSRGGFVQPIRELAAQSRREGCDDNIHCHAGLAELAAITFPTTLR